MKPDHIFKVISPQDPALIPVLELAIGFPTPEKVQNILNSYTLPDCHILGCISRNELSGILGAEIILHEAIIRHIAVWEPFRCLKIGTALVQELSRRFPIHSIQAETDDEAVGFYKKTGFICKEITGPFGRRYRCSREYPQA